MTTFKNEILKFAAFASAIGCAGVGVAAVISGAAPAALGAGILAGAAGNGWLSLDKIGSLKDEKQALIEQLEQSKQALTEIESELRAKLSEIMAERDALKLKLEDEIESVKTRCQTLKSIVEFYEVGTDPGLLDLPVIKSHVEALKQQLLAKVQEAKQVRLELLRITEENEAIKQDADEVHSRNEDLDQRLADLTNEYKLLKENINREVQLQLYQQIQPYTSQAVALAIQEKLAEIDKLKAELSRTQDKLESNQKVMESISESMIPDIEKTFAGELSEFDSRIINLSRENKILQERIEELEAPRRFAGLTEIDATGNRIIDHFSKYNVIFDAHSTEMIPGGFTIKFRVDRNGDLTKLSGEEFSKMVSQRGLLGLSTRPLSFSFDQINFIVSVQIFSSFVPCPGHDPDMTGFAKNPSLSAMGGQLTTNLETAKTAKPKTGRATQTRSQTGHEPDTHRQKFIDLGCFPKDQFSELIAKRMKDKGRIIGGSASGKSPVVQAYCVEVAQRYARTRKNGAIVYFPNPLPGGDKDWFIVPSMVLSGEGGVAKVAECLDELLEEVLRRCSSGAESDEWPFIMLMLDEGNMIARYHDRQGELIKQILQAGSHAYVGLGCGGQGLEITGWSGRSDKPANMLRANDFLVGASHILMDEAVLLWLDKYFTGAQREELKEQYHKLTELCDELNALENRIDKPLAGDERKVSVNAYRFALATVPAGKPFFFQIPDYGDCSTEGLQFPPGARITSRYFDSEGRLLDSIAPAACPHCSCKTLHAIKPYKDGRPRYECGNRECRKKFGRSK